MREPTALIKEFEEVEVTEPTERKKREDEFSPSVFNTFSLPSRNWTALISDYNAANKRKFSLSDLECKIIVELVKRGQPPEYIFQTLGITLPRYRNLVNSSMDMEHALEELAVKPTLTEEEFDKFQLLMRNPLRILMADINRAEGLANLADWEFFNKESNRNVDVMMAKMKAKFKEKFSDRDTAPAGTNVVINIGSDGWHENI